MPIVLATQVRISILQIVRLIFTIYRQIHCSGITCIMSYSKYVDRELTTLSQSGVSWNDRLRESRRSCLKGRTNFLTCRNCARTVWTLKGHYITRHKITVHYVSSCYATLRLRFTLYFYIVLHCVALYYIAYYYNVLGKCLQL